MRPSSLRDYWRGQRKALRQLLWGVNPKGSMGTALVQALRQPLTHHVQKYALLLRSLGDTVGEVSGGGQGCSPACGLWAAEAGETQGPGSGRLRNAGTWFEKDPARLWGRGPVLRGLEGHVCPGLVRGSWPCPGGAGRDPGRRRGVILGVRAQAQAQLGRPGASCFPVRPVRRPRPEELWGERVPWG